MTLLTTPRSAHLGFYLLLLAILSGCTNIRSLEYGAFVRDLDGLSELKITTYPADFANRLTDKGAVFQKYESAREVYFQVNIRDKSKSMGPNEHVESVRVHSFSYQVEGQPAVVLLSDYDDNFWMQGNPRYDDRELPPIPYLPDSRIAVRIAFMLNGEEYDFQGEMPANESSSTWPTFIVEQGV